MRVCCCCCCLEHGPCPLPSCYPSSSRPSFVGNLLNKGVRHSTVAHIGESLVADNVSFHASFSSWLFADSATAWPLNPSPFSLLESLGAAPISPEKFLIPLFLDHWGTRRKCMSLLPKCNLVFLGLYDSVLLMTLRCGVERI